ncbi:MAG TPA: hypothetical protein VNN19_06220 [bacterium]|nr:hypothetical protein [bacterium]
MSTTVSPGEAQAASVGAAEAASAGRPCRAAATSFNAGLVAIRLCWLPGLNLLLATAALAYGVLALWEIGRSRGRMTGLDEAVSGLVLGVLAFGLSVFFLSLLFAGLR